MNDLKQFNLKSILLNFILNDVTISWMAASYHLYKYYISTRIKIKCFKCLKT